MKTLTLRPKPVRMIQKAMPPVPADPVKIGLAQSLGMRFIARHGRYILQTRTVNYPPPTVGAPDHTWIDIPLVPEVYG